MRLADGWQALALNVLLCPESLLLLLLLLLLLFWSFRASIFHGTDISFINSHYSVHLSYSRGKPRKMSARRP